MALKAKKPEVKEKRLKMFVYGKAGIGKTLAALRFPNSYIIDTEKGTEEYAELINESNSVVLQSLNPDEIKEELKQLLTTKHQYKTLIIDPITQVYNAVQEKWNRLFEKHSKSTKESEIQDFGMRYWGKVKSEFKSIQRIILALDMNVIITAHQKDVYGAGYSKLGVTFDSMKGDDYLFDIIFRIESQANKRVAIKDKERAMPDKNKFPDSFEWSYENFLKFYGKEIIEKESNPVEMADEKSVEKLNNLVKNLNIPDDATNKWLTKASVDSFEEFTKETINKCIKFCEDKIKSIGESKK